MKILAKNYNCKTQLDTGNTWGKRSLGRQQIFCDTWYRRFSCVKTLISPQKTGVETWFQIAGAAVNFSYLVCKYVKIVISNREIVDVLGCLDIEDHFK